MIPLSLQQISSIATQFNQGRGDVSASECSLYANIAVGTVASQDQYRSLESTYNFSITSGTSIVTLPADFFAALSLSLSSGSNNGFQTTMLPSSVEIIDSMGTFRSLPKVYAVYGSGMLVGPMSDSTYSGSMRYQTKIPMLMAIGDTPSLREEYHYAVALKTAELVSASRNDSEQEALNRQRYLDYMTSLPNDRALRQRDKLQGISMPRWFRK